MNTDMPSVHIPNTSQPPPYLLASKENLLLAMLPVKLLLSDNDTVFLQKKNSLQIKKVYRYTAMDSKMSYNNSVVLKSPSLLIQLFPRLKVWLWAYMIYLQCRQLLEPTVQNTKPSDVSSVLWAICIKTQITSQANTKLQTTSSSEN